MRRVGLVLPILRPGRVIFSVIWDKPWCPATLVGPAAKASTVASSEDGK